MLTNFGSSLSGPPIDFYIGLSTTTPTVGSNSNWNFSEPTTSDYARVLSDTNSSWTVSDLLTFNQAANPWGSIIYAGLWDSPANGNLLGFLELVLPVNVVGGSLVYFSAASLNFTANTAIANGFNPPLPFIYNGGTVNKQREPWALQQARRYVSDALMWYGEQCIVRLKWRAEDFTAGYCERCYSCNDSPNPQNTQDYQSVLIRVANVYKQTGDSFCPVCNGVGFTGPNQSGGGFKPIIYQTFIIATDTPEQRKRMNTLRFWQENPAITMYPVPTVKDGDLVIRVQQWDKTNKIPLATGERFEAGMVRPQTIRSGPDNSITREQQVFNAEWDILVGQETTLKNLPIAHPWYQVVFYDPTIETINVQMNPNYIPHL